MTDKDDTTATIELRSAEQSVEAHSAVFKKELGLTDLVLTQILCVPSVTRRAVEKKACLA